MLYENVLLYLSELRSPGILVPIEERQLILVTMDSGLGFGVWGLGFRARGCLLPGVSIQMCRSGNWDPLFWVRFLEGCRTSFGALKRDPNSENYPHPSRFS